ncbi:ATP-binding cassette domain-containing protein [Streptomyces sp. SP17BM10]|uniref:ATP-binding cassette domain-containing protein n=1 Tax=Streptomyces sp. SP17BM10 TaxID=3002530 RepID=UPI003FCD075B
MRWPGIEETGGAQVGVVHGPALRLSGLRKRFGRTTAVAGVELSVPRGSCYGVVGPRGAGKGTVLALAAGLVRPDEGTAEVFGWASRRIRSAPVRRSGSCRTRSPCRHGRRVANCSAPSAGWAARTGRRRRPARGRCSRCSNSTAGSAPRRRTTIPGCANGWGWPSRCTPA